MKCEKCGDKIRSDKYQSKYVNGVSLGGFVMNALCDKCEQKDEPMELKPLDCPFCGKEPIYTKFNSGKEFVACSNNKCILSHSAIEKNEWNTRQPTDNTDHLNFIPPKSKDVKTYKVKLQPTGIEPLDEEKLYLFLSQYPLTAMSHKDTRDKISKDICSKFGTPKERLVELDWNKIEEVIFNYYSNTLPPGKDEIRDTAGLAKIICQRFGARPVSEEEIAEIAQKAIMDWNHTPLTKELNPVKNVIAKAIVAHLKKVD